MNVALLGTAIHDARFRLPTQASDVGWAPWDDAHQSRVFFLVCLFVLCYKTFTHNSSPTVCRKEGLSHRKGIYTFELEAFDNRRAPYNGTL